LSPETITIEKVFANTIECGVRVEKLEEYQDKQNGHLGRIENNVKDLDKKIDGIKNWLMGLFGSMLIGLVLIGVKFFVK